jgi:hypothetical protein
LFDTARTSVERGQTIIHELVHLVTGANDVWLANKLFGGRWQAPKGKENDPDTVFQAGRAWHSKLAEKCKLWVPEILAPIFRIFWHQSRSER